MGKTGCVKAEARSKMVILFYLCILLCVYEMTAGIKVILYDFVASFVGLRSARRYWWEGPSINSVFRCVDCTDIGYST